MKRVYISVTAVFAVTISLFVLLSVHFGSSIMDQQSRLLYGERIKVGRMAIDHFVNNARTPLLDNDVLSLNILLKQADSIGLKYALMTNGSNIIIAHSSPENIGASFQDIVSPSQKEEDGGIVYQTYTNNKGERTISISKPVIFMDKTLAFLHVGLSLDSITAFIARERAPLVRTVKNAAIALLALIVSAGIALVVLLKYSYGNNPSRVTPAYRPELQIEPEKDPALRNSVEGTIPQGPDIASRGEMQSNNVSIVFIGIKEFGTYPHAESPKGFTADFNQYLSVVTNVIKECGGHVDSFLGDSVIAVFRNSPMSTDHVEKAINAALALRKAFRKNPAKGHLLSNTSISISSGIVLSGSIRLGSEIRLISIGKSIKAAHSLNVLARPGEIVISREVYDMVGKKIAIRPLPPQEILQRTPSWEIFCIAEE